MLNVTAGPRTAANNQERETNAPTPALGPVGNSVSPSGSERGSGTATRKPTPALRGMSPRAPPTQQEQAPVAPDVGARPPTPPADPSEDSDCIGKLPEDVNARKKGASSIVAIPPPPIEEPSPQPPADNTVQSEA